MGAGAASARGGSFAAGHAGDRLVEHAPGLNLLPLAPIMPLPRNAENRRSGPRAGHLADISVSYTKSDRDWAFWIAAELKELGRLLVNCQRTLQE
jgi:hypothetical protein